MDVERFWQLMEQADTPRALHGLLAALPEAELVAFERLHGEAVDRAYDWGVWGAAYVIHGGCGDDTFMDFRAYLMSRGRAIYEAALADPDSLADVEIEDDDGDHGSWEEWSSPTMMVVHARTGAYEFAGPLGPAARTPQDPRGEDWDEEDLPKRFPRLCARYEC
jgi:hypothetical protein